MEVVCLSAVVNEDHELMVKVPNWMPIGPVELLIQLPASSSPASINPAREAARAKLTAVGLLSAAHRLSSGASVPTDADVQTAGVLPPGALPSEDLINKDRHEV